MHPFPVNSERLSPSTSQPELAALVEQFTSGEGVHDTEIAPLKLYRYSTSDEIVHDVWSPGLCLIAQGCKKILLADEVHEQDTSEYLLLSVDLPLSIHAIDASPATPYLGLLLDLDPSEIGALAAQTNVTLTGSVNTQPGLAVSALSASLLDAVVRLLRLLQTPADIPVLFPLIVREIIYRLLTDPQGTRLRELTVTNSRTQRVTRAINWLKQNYANSIRIEDLALEANMSLSSLHQQFKTVTAMSPLQYQKQLRLQYARQMMLSEDVDAATASHRVGYESPSQFSREYRRFFGAPPGRDVSRLRSGSSQIK